MATEVVLHFKIEMPEKATMEPTRRALPSDHPPAPPDSAQATRAMATDAHPPFVEGGAMHDRDGSKPHTEAFGDHGSCATSGYRAGDHGSCMGVATG
jgi:hypothetical protein